jgi:hypothetical protein
LYLRHKPLETYTDVDVERGREFGMGDEIQLEVLWRSTGLRRAIKLLQFLTSSSLPNGPTLNLLENSQGDPILRRVLTGHQWQKLGGKTIQSC